MTRAILKWPLSLADIQMVAMPKGAKILAVQSHRDQLWIWALCDTDAEYEVRRIRIVTAGEKLPDDSEIEYLETFLWLFGSLVSHAFEIKD